MSILFADLAGFTAFSAETTPEHVARMLNGYFGTIIPLMEDCGGEVHQVVGDELMVIFNKAGDQPDHAALATRAGAMLQHAATQVAHDHPEWPRFRAAVNSGEVLAGLVGGSAATASTGSWATRSTSHPGYRQKHLSATSCSAPRRCGDCPPEPSSSDFQTSTSRGRPRLSRRTCSDGSAPTPSRPNAANDA